MKASQTNSSGLGDKTSVDLETRLQWTWRQDFSAVAENDTNVACVLSDTVGRVK